MIVFLGLSHLSLCYAASLIKLKKKVFIVDTDKEISNYKLGLTKIFEEGLDEILKQKSDFFKITSDNKILNTAKIIFLAKDVKTDSNNNIILKECFKLLKLTNKISKNKILVIMNQVPVGFTRSIKWKSNKIYHFVETLVFGNAIKRASNPERIIIGKSRHDIKIDRALRSLLNLYKSPIIEMTYEESELTKGYINTYLASQLATTNILSEICSKFSARWSIIFSAIGLDKRIGNLGYYKPGLGISGGNIERDLKTLSKLTKKFKIKNNLPDFLLDSSTYYKNFVLRLIKKNKMKKIAIFGLTYKDKTLSIKNSPQVNIIKNLNKMVKVHDFKSDKLIKKKQIKNLKIKFEKIETCLNFCETVIIFHNLKMYKNIKFSYYSNIKNVIDPYGFLSSLKINNKKYFRINN